MATWTIWTNVPITRRKSFHLVTDPTGETVFRNVKVWPCIDWLDAEGVKHYEIKPSEAVKGSRVATLSIDRE